MTAVVKRRHPRYEVSGLRGQYTISVAVEVLNLSLGGMALETASYLHFGRSYTLRLQGTGPSVFLTGQVTWCSLCRTARSELGEIVPTYRVGLKFEAMSGATVDELRQILQTHALVEVGKGVLGSLVLGVEQPVRLGSSYDFLVRKLSLCGMLIEIDHAPEVDSRFDLELRLGGQRWQTRGRVASIPWLGRRALGELTQVGVEFLELDSRDLSWLRIYLDRHKPAGLPGVDASSSR